MGEIVLATTRDRVTGLEALQDIDELLVTDAGGPLPPPPAPFAGRASSRGASSHRIAAADTEITPAGDGYGGGSGSDDEGKYAPRAGAAARALARLFPALIPAASLPVTRNDVEGGRGGRWGRRRGSTPAARGGARRVRGLILLLALIAGALYAANAALGGWSGGGLPAWGGGAAVERGEVAAVVPRDTAAPGW